MVLHPQQNLLTIDKEQFNDCGFKMVSNSNRILVAEDHYVSRHLLERNLSNWGFDVTTAENGVEAMEVLESPNPPPIAILDWMMPEMDGLEVCVRIRKQSELPYIYLLLLTAKSQKEEVAAGLEAGADDYVIKPFDPDELRARLKVGQRVVNLERMLSKKTRDLEAARLDVRKMSSLLPVCMRCKSVRDDRDYWHQVEEYMNAHPDTEFSHSICPNCLKKINNEIARSGITTQNSAIE